MTSEYKKALTIQEEFERVSKIKCQHDDAHYVQQCAGDSSAHIFECRDCGEYIVVEEHESPYDWDGASVIPKYYYENYDLENKEDECYE